MRGLVYDIVGLGFMIASSYFLYRCVEFLAQKNYVGGLIALIAGVVMVRAGSELSKLGLYMRRERS